MPLIGRHVLLTVRHGTYCDRLVFAYVRFMSHNLPFLLPSELVRLFRYNQRKRRIILPLLKTLDKLLNRGCLNGLIHVPESTFCVSLLSCMMVEALGCNDVHTLLAIVSVSLGLLSPQHHQQVRSFAAWNRLHHLSTLSYPCAIVPLQLNDEILTFLCQMLGHDFPRVRRFTADNLYVHFLEEAELISNQGSLEVALQLLLEAPWDADMDRKGANELPTRFAEVIGITLMTGIVLEDDASKKERVVDEFASYASLVNSRS